MPVRFANGTRNGGQELRPHTTKHSHLDPRTGRPAEYQDGLRVPTAGRGDFRGLGVVNPWGGDEDMVEQFKDALKDYEKLVDDLDELGTRCWQGLEYSDDRKFLH